MKTERGLWHHLHPPSRVSDWQLKLLSWSDFALQQDFEVSFILVRASISFHLQWTNDYLHIPCTKNDWITFWQIVDLSCMTHFFHFINLMISEKKWRLKWASYILPRSYQNWWCSCINFDLQATEIHVHSNHFDQCYGD